MKKFQKTPEKFKFKRHASIGAAAAEDDERYLANCFIDTGDLAVLEDCSEPRRIIIGRTGSGKTALINRVKASVDAIEILPQNLSFNYLANSAILQSLVATGVNLDLFFKLLWRHVFVVELLKGRYHIKNRSDQESFLNRISSWLNRDKKKQKAIDYLMQFGDKFWEETEYQVKEVTQKFSDNLKSNLGAKFYILESGIESVEQLTTEEKAELNEAAQKVINEIQLRELANILEFLNEDVFNDSKQQFYIVIDRLDENWVDDKFRFLLIRSLIETLREFRQVHNVKIITGLRTDLLERVIRFTRDGGFQEEKYRSLYLPLRWSRQQLKQVLDKRVDFLVQSAYTTSAVTAMQLLPSSINRRPPVDYMIDRTLLRPRELIEFFNTCMEQAEGKTTINRAALLKAEGIFSKNRLRSLQDEWFGDYPKLIEFTELIKGKPNQFKVGVISDDEVINYCLNYVTRFEQFDDYLSDLAREVGTCTSQDQERVCLDFLKGLFQVFYRVGIIGLKTESFEEMEWSYTGANTISAGVISKQTSVAIHQTYWRVLGIDQPRGE